MSALRVNDFVSFNDLKDLLQITDGNLASHAKALEEANIIKINKSFVGKKTNTNYSMTKTGEKLFNQHIQALEIMIGRIK